MKKSFLEYPTDRLEKLIRDGSLQLATKEVLAIPVKKLSPVDLSLHCSFLRRLGLSATAIQLLRPLVYPKARISNVASPIEVLEYAACLIRLGILGEAEQLLKTLSFKLYPVALIRLAFLEIARWDYQQSNVYLEKYLQIASADSYEFAIAQLNYLQGLAYLSQTETGFQFAKDLIRQFRLKKYNLLLVGALEFQAELHRQNKDFNQARKSINEAFEILGASSTIDEFLLRKQNAIIDLYDSLSDESLKKVYKLKEEARLRSHFESVRDLDYHLSLATKDKELLMNCFFLTRAEGFRSRIRNACSSLNWQIDFSHFRIDGKSRKSDKQNKVYRLNITSMVGEHKTNLQKNQKLIMLLRTLLSEGYAPQFVPDLFEAVYPGEHYSPIHSKIKVHQAISRLNMQIRRNRWPFQILYSKKSGYKVKFLQTVDLAFSPEINDECFLQVQKKFGVNSFSLEQLLEVLNKPRRSVFRLIDTWAELRIIEKAGNNRNRTYRVRSLSHSLD